MQMDRVHESMLSVVEKKTLIWIAQRMPASVNSDHLTALGFVSLAGVGLSYWYAGHAKIGLMLAALFLVLNWFGDSLDGTLARVRNRQRPRYGFYLDHVLDAFGSVFVFAGLALSGYMSERIAVGLLVVYLLLSIEVYLTTHTIGKFHLSFAAFGPTELRLLLIAGNIALLFRPVVPLAGKTYLLFDVGGAIGIAGLAVAAVWSAIEHGMFLYDAERLS
jgi:archaetidylinositol phosphate synthase